MTNVSKLIAIAITLTTVVFPVTSFAQASPSSSASSKLVDVTTQRINALKAKANNEIDRRLISLNLVMGQLNANTKLSATSKTALITIIQAEITNLTSLKAKIAADTELPTLKADVNTITKSYRVYALVMPQVAIVKASDRVITTADSLSMMLVKLQAAVDAAETNGQDTTTIQKTLDGIPAKIANAKTQAQAVQTAVLPLTPEGYPGNRSTLTSSRSKVMTAHRELKSAMKDMQSVNQSLKQLTKAASPVTATPSATTATGASTLRR